MPSPLIQISRKRLRKLFEKKVIRFLIFGAITAAFNVALISMIINKFQIGTPLLRNVANLAAIEISLIFTFVVYRIWVWRIKTWNLKILLLKQLPSFHAASGLVVLMRSLIIFPLLDWLGIGYIVNTLVGIVVGAAFNYVFTDQIVFKN